MAFPTIQYPSNIEEKRAFNTIAVEFDGGYKQTRERHTRDLKKFTASYIALSRTDKDLLEAHYETVRGSVPFDWINADTNITYSVRYADSISITADASMPNLFNISLSLEEV